MSRSSALILLGVLVVIAPLSGLPVSWITFLLAVFGIIIALIGIALRSENVRRARDAQFVPPTLPTMESSAEHSPEPVVEQHEQHAHHRPSSIA